MVALIIIMVVSIGIWLMTKPWCNHTYEYYNKKVKYPIGSMYGYYVFEFVCPKCKKTKSVSELDIRDEYDYLQSQYNKAVALGGEQVPSAEFTMPSCTTPRLFRGPAAALLLQKYLDKGIDLQDLWE